MDDLKFIIGVDDRDLIRAQKEQRKFERNLITIEQAFRKGDITAGRYTAELNKQAKQLSRLGGSYQTANSEVRKFSSQLRQASDASLSQASNMAFAGKNVNRLGMQMQQAGYQVGDFAVQVQGGTNVMVALGQQGAQLLGIFGPAGAIAGAGLAIGTALVAPLMKGREAAKDLTAEIKKLGEELTLLQSGAESQLALERASKIAEVEGKIFDLKNKTYDTTHMTSELQKDFEKDIAAAKKADEDRLKVLQDELNSLREKAKAIQINKDLIGSEVLEAENLHKNQVQANRDRLAQEKLHLEELAKISEAELLLGQQMVDVAGNAAKITRELELSREAAMKAADEFVILQGLRQRFAGEDALMGMSLTPSKQKGPDPAEEKKIKRLEDARQKLLDKLKLSTQEQLVIQGLKDRELLVAEQFNEKYKLQLELEKLGIEYGSARYDRALELLDTQQESVRIAYDQLEAEKKLAEEKQRQGEIIESIGGIIGDGFISMVEGTESVKDAFKSMARAIIKELYQVLVVQQMVNAAKAAFGIPVPNANGNVFSSGSIQPYADGGVVNSPTTFPMTGGKTGLMGEAGPEAIMPLKRGANGKLGVQMEGGATTTVVQNFNFSANGDDSVKRIIAQAAPKIAQMTKSEIINDRRRGGTMKATFG